MRPSRSRLPSIALGAVLLALSAGADEFGGKYHGLLSSAANTQPGRTCDPNDEDCSCISGNCPQSATAGATNPSPKSGTGSQAGKTGRPIDGFTGRESHQAVDLEVNGVFPIRIIRDYDSQSFFDSPLGYGWALNYDLRVFEYPNGDVLVRSRAGTRDVYTDTDPGPGVTLAPKNPALGRIPTLEPGAAAGTYVLTYASGMRAFFDVEGRLEALEQRQGNRLLFSYCNDPDDDPPCNTTPTQKALSGISPFAITPNALQTVATVWQLTRIREQFASGPLTGRFVKLRYDANTGRLVQIDSHDGRVVQYQHNEAQFRPGTAASYRGNLARVIGLEGIISEYRYPGYPLDTVISGSDIHNLTYAQEGPGTEPVLNDYGGDEKVDKQTIGQMEWTYTYSAGPPVSTTVSRKIVTSATPTPTVTTADTTFEFNPEGHVTKRIDALGHQLRYLREAGRPYVDKIEVRENGTTLVRTEDPGYDGDGNRSQQQVTLSATGDTVSESRTYFDDMIASEEVSSTDADPNVFRTEYTFFEDDGDAIAGNGRPVNVKEIKRRKSDSSFETTAFTYDANGQLATITPSAVTPADGLEIRRTYYDASDDGGGVTRNGLLAQIEVYVSGVPDPHLKRSFDYDAAGHLASTTDAKGHRTSFEFDDRGRLLRRTEEIGSASSPSTWESTLFVYSAPNAIDPATTLAGEHLVRVEEGALGDPAGSLTPGRVQRLRWDARGNLVQVERWDGSAYQDFGTFVYDSDGNRISATVPVDPSNADPAQPDFRTVAMVYNKMRQLTQIADGAGNLTDFSYDALGHRKLIRDGDSPRNDTTFAYDELDRLIATNASGLVTDFRYDAAGNVTRVEDPKDQATVYGYDPLSRLTSVAPPVAGTAVSYGYDSRGRLSRITNARGHALDHFYAPWGGLERVDTYGNVSDANAATSRLRRVSYTHDDNGNLLTTSDDTLTAMAPAGLLYTFSYDALNRVDTTEAHYLPGGDRVLDSDYDGSGNRTHLHVETQLPAGGTADLLAHEWRFDGRNRLTEAVFPGGADPTLALAYWASDDLRLLTHGNGATTQLRYESHGPVDAITVANAASTQLHQLVYGYDGVLNVDTLSESIGTTAASPPYGYGYDPQQRLTSAVYPALSGLPASENFPYDAAGNRDDDPAADSPWRYDANNRIERSPVPGGTTGTRLYSSDLDGNLLTVSQAGVPPIARVLTFDWSNRLKRVDEGVVPLVAYEYDPFGRRIRKVVTQAGLPLNVTTYYLWDGDRLLAEYSDTGARKVRYAYAEGFAPAQVAYGPAGSETIYDVHSDHLDTPRMLTNAAGVAKWRASYQAFGQAALDPANTVTFNIRFPGQYFDAETGWHDNRWRYFSPEIGRYISADPIGQQGGVNTYEYAFSNPLARADLYGLTSIQVNFNAPTTNTSITLGQPSTTRQGVTFDPNSGQVTVTDPNANVTATFPAVSGPHGQGALPPGTYTTAGPVVNIPNTPGNASFCDPSGNCWWQPLTPQFSTPRGQPGNGRFGFHPDGGVPGTSGCIGATQQNTSGAQGALGGLPPGSTVLVLP